jgi:hypothetical protein
VSCAPHWVIQDITDGLFRAMPKLLPHWRSCCTKDTKYIWTQECQEALDTLKEKLVTASILVFPNWSKLFHVHVDASSIALGVVLAQPSEGNIDHPVYFSSHKLSDAENNYTTTEHEGLTMVYALQKFHHYLLGTPFKLFTDHSMLKYLVNKPVLGGRICHWLFLFQEFEFEVVVKPGKYNVGPRSSVTGLRLVKLVRV